jgi:hypothetical protein
MPRCRLCLEDRELRNSHIVPEFLYVDLYNGDHKMMGINGRGSNGWQIQQKGIREHLFCEECEQHFNKNFEKPFHESWIKNCPLPSPWVTDQIIKVDYDSFKLFHLSVLFRASVSSLAMFSEVSLGPHEERLRKMLFDVASGSQEIYPIFGWAVIHHETNEVIKMVSKAQLRKYGRHHCYGIMYGGVQWWVCVASDKNHEIQQVALRNDGTMRLIAIPWNKVPVVKEASDALRKCIISSQPNSS